MIRHFEVTYVTIIKNKNDEYSEDVEQGTESTLTGKINQNAETVERLETALYYVDGS